VRLPCLRWCFDFALAGAAIRENIANAKKIANNFDFTLTLPRHAWKTTCTGDILTLHFANAYAFRRAETEKATLSVPDLGGESDGPYPGRVSN
jgi:hypothetical protein